MADVDPMNLPGADPATTTAKRSNTTSTTAAGSAPGTKADAKKIAAAASKPKAKRRPGRPSTRQATTRSLEERLSEAFAGLGLAALALAPADGLVIMARGPALATALANWAAENDAVARFLERALTASAVGGVMTAFAALALPIAANHGVIPAQLGAAFALRPDELPDELTALLNVTIPDVADAANGG